MQEEIFTKNIFLAKLYNSLARKITNFNFYYSETVGIPYTVVSSAV